MKITDIINSKHAQDIEIQYNSDISVDRVKEITMNNIETKKNRKIFKRVICGVVCVALASTMSIGAYAVSPEVQNFVDSIFQRNKQRIDNIYSQEEQTLMGENLRIGDSSTSANDVNTFQDFDISLSAIINRGYSADLILTLDFSKNPEFLQQFKDKNFYFQFKDIDFTPILEGTPTIKSGCGGDIDINFENNTITYYWSFNEINIGVGDVPIQPTDMYNFTLKDVEYGIFENLNEETNEFIDIVEKGNLVGEYSTQFCFGESANTNQVDVNKDVSWTYKSSGEWTNYDNIDGTYDFTVNSIEYNNLELKLNTTYNFIEKEGVGNHTALFEVFDTLECLDCFYNNRTEYEDYVALKLIDNDNNITIVPYNVTSSDNGLMISFVDEPHYVGDNVENVQLIFSFATPINIDDFKAIEFCGEEIPIK